jgi:hypothetical protein
MTGERNARLEVSSAWLSDPTTLIGLFVLPALGGAALTLGLEIPGALLTVFRLLLTL